MNFRVAISETLEDKIAGWNLSDGFRQLVYRTIIDEVGNRPSKHLGREIRATFRGRIFRTRLTLSETGEERDLILWIHEKPGDNMRLILDAQCRE